MNGLGKAAYSGKKIGCFTFAGSNPMKQPRGSSFGMGPFQLSLKVAIPLRRMALLLIFLPLFPRIIDAKEANNSFSVTVRCSANAMEMFVQFREPFNGRLKVRPDGQCFVNGRGRLNVGFRLPLDERHRKKCSIIRREAEFIALVDLEMNPSLATADDNSYFVRCPILREGEMRGEEREKGNLSARIGPLDAEMRILAEEGKMMNLSLDTAAGQKVYFRQCIAFSPLAGPDGQLQAIQLGNQNSSCGHFAAGKKFVQFRPPNFEGKEKNGTFFVQCEIVEMGNGETEEESACNTNSSSIGPLHRSLASIRLAYPLSNAPSECSPPPPPLEEYLLAILLGVLLALGIASICLIAVHLLGKRRNRRPNHRGMLLMGRGGRKNSKRVQIVCPTISSSSTAPVHYASGLSFPGPSLSFGSSPIQQPALFCCPPPSPPPPLPSLHSPQCPECPSPTSTVTTALALSLDKLPEPPSLSLAEIRQLNLAFNGFMMANGADGKEGKGQKEEEGEYLQPPKQQMGRVYSFAGIRLNSQQMEMEKNNNCWINY